MPGFRDVLTTCRMRSAIARTRTGSFNPTHYTIGATGLANIFGAAGNPIPARAAPPKTPLALRVPGGAFNPTCTPRPLVEYSGQGRTWELAQNTSLQRGAMSAAAAITEIIGEDANGARAGGLSRGAMPGNVSDNHKSRNGSASMGRISGTACTGGNVFQSHEHQAKHCTGKYLDMGLARAQHVQRTAGGSEPSLQRRAVRSRRVHSGQGDGRWRLAQRHGRE